MAEPSFKEFTWALKYVDGRHVKRNFGMNPYLGKYYTTVCSQCLEPLSVDAGKCHNCGSAKIIKGVFDRIQELKNADEDKRNRPLYLYQVPLEYLPALGPKTFARLLEHFQTEMNVIHHATFAELKEIIPEKLAATIIDMREGRLSIKAGGGGKYGSVTSSSS